MDSNFFIQLPELNFPENYQFRLKKLDNKPYIFCPLRKNWFVLTPEEWVRQHVTQYLILQKNYSLESIKAEHPVNIHGLRQRIDLLVYQKTQPYLLIECKRPEVTVTQETLNQALRYNQSIKARYVYLTNGIKHIVADCRPNDVIFHQEIPVRNLHLS